MIRAIRPTDLAELARFNGQALPNVARSVSRPSSATGQTLGFGSFLGEWLSLDEARHSWVALEAGRITGAVSARQTASAAAWEVDRLRLTQDTSPETATDLLDFLAAVAAENQVARVFLRMDSRGALETAALQAGFGAYRRETLCMLPGGGPPAPPSSQYRIRPRTVEDGPGLFRFWCSVVPADVRRATAMLSSEWQWLFPHPGRSYGQRQLIVEAEGQIIGWATLLRRSPAVVVEIVTDPGEHDASLALLQEAIAWARRTQYVLLPVPAYHDRLASLAGDHGGRPIAHLTASVRQLAIRVRASAMVPVGI